MLDLRPLRLGSFRHLALGYWVNEFGTWIGEIALTILVYDHTHSPLETAALFLALRFLPAFLAPLLTAWVETLTPRIVLGVAYVVEGALFLGLAAVARAYTTPVILLLASLDGVLAITAKALTRSAVAASLKEQELLREGNGILNLGLMSSTACAPVLAGALVAWHGVRWALLVDAGTFLATALIIGTATGLHVQRDLGSDFSTRLRTGARVIRSRTAVRRLINVVALGMLLGAIPIPVEVIFAKHTLHAGNLGYGLLLGAWGVGTVVGAAAFTVASSVRLMTMLAIGALAIAAGYGGLALAPSLAIACIASAMGGAGNGAGWIAALTSIQERIPLDAQSAVMTLVEGLNQVAPAVGFVLGGVLTAAASPRLAYAVAAAGVLALLAAAAARPVDRVVFSGGHSPEPADPARSRPEPQDSAAPSRTSPSATLTAR